MQHYTNIITILLPIIIIITIITSYHYYHTITNSKVPIPKAVDSEEGKDL